MNNFEKYKKLKSQFDFVYKGIHFNRVLALPLWQLANGTFRLSWKAHALAFLSIDVGKMQFPTGNQTILSTFGRYTGRRDHLEIYRTVLNKLGGQASYNDTTKWSYKLAFHLRIMAAVWRYVRKEMSESPLTFMEKIDLAVWCIHYCNTLEEIRKLDFSGVKKYLCQCSVLDLENLMTQYMKLQGMPTYSLQEGMYYIFKTNPPIDSVQYENFETDNLLCWGQFSIDEDHSYGIPAERLRLAGYPKDVELHALKSDNLFRRCMILLARDTFRETNNKLLGILSDFSSGYEFCLKLHPSCDYGYYEQYASSHNMSIVSKEKTINDSLDIEEYDFCIGVNTTAYYESLMRGLPCLRFWDGSFDLPAGCKYDVFTTKEDFTTCLGTLKNKSNAEYQTDINEVLRYAMGIGIDNYRKILCGY